jgi:ABC-type antimicrobial peptide transport system permease subunit
VVELIGVQLSGATMRDIKIQYLPEAGAFGAVSSIIGISI